MVRPIPHHVLVHLDGSCPLRFAAAVKILEKNSVAPNPLAAGRLRSPLVGTLGMLVATLDAAKLAAIELVLPPVCRLCNAPVPSTKDFCRRCDGELNLTTLSMKSACRRCGIPRFVTVNPANTPEHDLKPPDCIQCRSREMPFDGVVALWSYQGRVCDAVVAAKYVHNGPLADAMGRRLGQRAVEYFGELASDGLPDCVTYVPSHLTRQMTRGGNGVVAVAQKVAVAIDRPCRNLLRLTRPIAKQAWLDDEMRQKNVSGAFSVRKSYASPSSPQVANRHILVVDDVLTTGATASEVAQALKRAGATRVTLAVIARAIRGR